MSNPTTTPDPFDEPFEVVAEPLPFVQIKRNAITDQAIDAQAFRAYAYVMSRTPEGTTTATIAEGLNVSVGSAEFSIGQLRAAGWLQS